MTPLPVEPLLPSGEPGVPLDPEVYRVVRYAVVSALGASDSVDFSALALEVEGRLGVCVPGSVTRYVGMVQRELEAQGVIERVPLEARHRLRLADA